MAWAFEEPVVAIVDDGYAVKVSTKLGTYRSKAVVCTLPLNVASSVHVSVCTFISTSGPSDPAY